MPSLARSVLSVLPRSRMLAGLAAAAAAGTAAAAALQIAWSRNLPAVAAVRPVETGAPAPAVERPQPKWTVVRDPEPLFGMGPGLYPVPVRHEVRRLDDGVTRMDVFTFGDPRAGSFARLVLERLTDASPAEGGLFVTVARNAAAEGFAVERVSLSAMTQSRFGAMETAEVTLAGEATSLTCTVFRGTADGGPLRYSGWSCGAPKTAEAARCLVDAVTFSPEIHEPGMARVFDESEGRIAPGCRPAPKPVPEFTSSVSPKPGKGKPKG